MITGINDLRIYSVLITDWETNFTDLRANDFGNLGKNNSGNILVGNHAVIFTEINSPRIFVRSVMFVWTLLKNLARHKSPRRFHVCLLSKESWMTLTL